MKWKCLLVFCILFVAQISGVSSASATSDYDDFFSTQTTTTLINDIDNYAGMSCGSSTDDYADSWMDAMRTNNVYSSDPAHGIAMASFDAAIAGNGGWMVQYEQVNNGNNSSNPYFIKVYWADDASQWEHVFSTYGSDQYLTLQRKAGVPTSVTLQEGVIGSTQLIQGGGGCDVEWLWGGANYRTGGVSILKGTHYKLFSSTFELADTPGYAGPAMPGKRAQYVALGDSYASGEGNPSYLEGSDTFSNMCHRSDHAWPLQVESQSPEKVDLMTFAACSGAVNDYLINSYNTENVELPQALYVSDQTDVVTLSIGGNDIGFGDVIAACMASNTAQGCIDAVDSASELINTSFIADIQDSLEGLRTLGRGDTLTREGTNIILVGYPNLYPEFDNISGSCSWGDSIMHSASPNQISGRTITEAEIIALRELHDDLNEALLTAKDNLLDDNVHFVNPSSAFAGHEICGASDDWMFQIALHTSTNELHVGSFHPNNDGMAGYEALITNKINEIIP